MFAAALAVVLAPLAYVIIFSLDVTPLLIAQGLDGGALNVIAAILSYWLMYLLALIFQPFMLLYQPSNWSYLLSLGEVYLPIVWGALYGGWLGRSLGEQLAGELAPRRAWPGQL